MKQDDASYKNNNSKEFSIYNPDVDKSNKKLSKTTKRAILIAMSLILGLGIIMCIIFRFNIMFNFFPKITTLYSYNKTINRAEYETNEFINNMANYINTIDLKKGNNIIFTLPNVYLNITDYDDMNKGTIKLYENMEFLYYLDKTEFIFNINGGTYYSFQLSENLTQENNYILPISTANTAVSEENLHIYDNLDNLKGNFYEYLSELQQDSNFDAIKSKLFTNLEVTTSNNTISVYDIYNIEDFNYLIWFLTDHMDSNFAKTSIRFLTTFFVDDAKNICFTSKFNSIDKLGNVIREFSITTDSSSDKYIKITSSDKNSLISNIKISYKFLNSDQIINIKTFFDDDNNEANFHINDTLFNLSFNSDDASRLVFSINNNNFITISDDLSLPTKPKNTRKINNFDGNLILENLFNNLITN